MKYRGGLDLLNSCENKKPVGEEPHPCSLQPCLCRHRNTCRGVTACAPPGDGDRGHFYDIPLSRGLGSY